MPKGRLGTECSKCGAAMPPLVQASQGILAHLKVTVTGYLCKECGHFNNLKRRKFMREARRKV